MIRANCVILLFLLVLSGANVVLGGCATGLPVTSDRIRSEMAAIIKDVSVDRNTMSALREKRVGKSGFYYVIDNDARVVFHPRSPLIGSSFSKVWFVKQILSEKNGCITYILGNRTHYLFFSPLNDSEILCLSILSDDLARHKECRAAEIKPVD